MLLYEQALLNPEQRVNLYVSSKRLFSKRENAQLVD